MYLNPFACFHVRLFIYLSIFPQLSLFHSPLYLLSFSPFPPSPLILLPCRYTVPVEGSITFSSVAKLGPHIRRDCVRFIQGDATVLPDILPLIPPKAISSSSSSNSSGKFDLIVGANLIDRLPSPIAFINSLPQMLNQGGIVVLTSPYTWLSEYTPKTEWLGGYVTADGVPHSTFDTLKSLFAKAGFALLHQSHMPFLIRETGRKHQFTFAHATVWKKL